MTEPWKTAPNDSPFMPPIADNAELNGNDDFPIKRGHVVTSRLYGFMYHAVVVVSIDQSDMSMIGYFRNDDGRTLRFFANDDWTDDKD